MSGSETDFALLRYKTNNLGDEIQSLAAREFLPSVDRYLDRDDLDGARLTRPTRVVLNGWYTQSPGDWPPSNPLLAPLLTSFHISDAFGSSRDSLTSAASIAFYKRHEPVGCRDYATTALLQAKGVSAYYSGCLTLALGLRGGTRTNWVYAVDVPESILARAVPDADERRSIIRVTHQKFGSHGSRWTRRCYSLARRRLFRPFFWRANYLLDRYARARFVLTTRLHCALPCLALETPVVMLNRYPDDPRFEPLASYVNSHSFAQIEDGLTIDCTSPQSNPEKPIHLIDSIRRTVRAFVLAPREEPSRRR